MVDAKTTLQISWYYHMAFFIGLTFFTEQLAEGYKVGDAAKSTHVLAMMKGMFFMPHSSPMPSCMPFPPYAHRNIIL